MKNNLNNYYQNLEHRFKINYVTPNSNKSEYITLDTNLTSKHILEYNSLII